MAILFFILRLIGWVLLAILLLLVVALLLPLGIQAAYRPGEAFAKAFYGPLKFTLWPRGGTQGAQSKAKSKPTVMSHAFSADTANKLTQMMEAVVTKENTNLAINGVQVAVKTGTAQIGNGNTSIDGWVIGFAPADDPKIAVAVVVHNVDLYGSFAAGPIMKAMMQEALAE